MLDFWYSERCTRQIKLIICIAVCAVIYYCSNIQQLSPLFTGLSLAVGLALHFLRIAHLNIVNTNSYKPIFQIIFSMLPIIALIFMHMKEGEILIPGAQGIGFMALAICLFSPLSLLNQNQPKNEDL